MKILFRKYLAAIIFSTAIFIFLVIKMRNCLYDYRVNQLSSHLYKELKSELDRMGSGAATGISEKEIYQKYLSTDAFKNTVRRDNLTFMDRVMPKLDQLRRKDSKIIQIERTQFGRPV